MTDSLPPASFRTVPDVLTTKATELGEEPFLQCQERTVTFAELDRNANAVANELLARGGEPGDRVCLYQYNSPEYLSLFFALAKIGAVAVPIDTRFTDDTLTYVLSKTEADMLVFDAETRADYEAIRNDLPTLTNEYYLSDGSTDHPYREFAELQGEDTAPPDVSVSETDTLSITFVQRRTTEQPRGVMLPQFSYVNTGWEAAMNLFNLTSDDRVFTTLPLYSIFTFQIGVMGTLLADAEFVLETRFEPTRFWDQIDAADATVFLYLSRMLSLLYNQDIEPEGETPAELAIGHSLGFAADETLFENFEERFDIEILEGYGVTDAATVATYNRPTDRRLGSVGKPASYVDVQVVDENDWPVSPGESGEIVLRSTRPNAMMQGYLDEPERSLEVCRNQWIHTEDIGYKDEDGYLYFVANRENSIYRGRIAGRISTLEIESVIDAHPAVGETAVIGVTNEDGDEEIKAVVTPEADGDIDPVDISKHCEQRLPYIKIPRYIEVRDELPRSPSGKIRKRDLEGVSRDRTWDRESGYELSR